MWTIGRPHGADPVAVLHRGWGGLSPPNHEKFQVWYIIFFAGVIKPTDLTGCAIAKYEANEATALVKFVASVKIWLADKK